MSVIVARLLGKPCLLELVNLVHENDRKLFQSETYARYGASWQLVSKNKQLDFCLTRYCLNPKNSTQSATSSIFQERQEGAPSESKVGSNPLSNLVGVFLELLTSPSAIFVYRGNSVCYPKSLYDTRYQIWRWRGLVGVSPLLVCDSEGGICWNLWWSSKLRLQSQLSF